MKSNLKTITRTMDIVIQIAIGIISNFLYEAIKRLFRTFSERIQIGSLREQIDSLRRFFYSVETVNYWDHSFSRTHSYPFQVWKHMVCTYTKVYKVLAIFKFKRTQREHYSYPEVF